MMWPFRRNKKYGLKKLKFRCPSTEYFQVTFEGMPVTLRPFEPVDIKITLVDGSYRLTWKRSLTVE